MMKLQFVTFASAAAIIFICLIPTQSAANPITDCWDQWSRCSGWSSGGNGVLWQPCNEHCICMGFAQGGSCVKVPSKCFLVREAKQCQCNGPKGQPTGEDCGP